MVQGLSTFLGGLNKNGQIVLGLLLADIFPQRLGPQRSLLGVFLQEGLGHNRLLIDVASKINAQSATSLSLRTRRLIIGKFCALASGVQFIMGSANHRLDSISTYPFNVFGGAWEANTPPHLSQLPFKGDTVVGNDVWIGRESVVMPAAFRSPLVAAARRVPSGILVPSAGVGSSRGI